MGTKKRCPYCEKWIPCATMKCKHCGALIQELLLRTDPSMAVPPRATAAPTQSIKVLFYVIIVGIAVAGGLSSIRHDELAKLPTAGPYRMETAKDQPAWLIYRTTAPSLYHDYAAYEAAKTRRTGTLAIEITGTINAIDHNMFDEPEINLDTGEGSGSVNLTLDKLPLDRSQSLAIGRRVKVRCDDMSEILGAPIGQSCRLIE